ncbi:type VI secretion system membrane subunit TssM [Roseateles sp. BYS180W]|uniref:Type VI secretion system membrane subunit TssM n=1 Tax=Roseateles rivi TaxID=3299028 RepID=A0ABW7FT18_9BURK
MSAFMQSAKFRALLVFLGVVLLGLAIWFVGPLLAFGEARPLASVSARVITLVLLLLLGVFVLLEWTLSVLAVVALCLLVWHAGPLLALGDAQNPWRPLAGEWPRVLTIAVIALVYLVWALLRLWHMIRNDEAFAKRVFRLEQRNPAQALAREEIRVLQTKADRATTELRRMRSTVAGHTGAVTAFLRRLVEGKRYLYELPWYMLIGHPGAGKSSLITNAGLTFPLADQMQAASVFSLEGPDRGTLNCNWWFTNEAVLIDTAGRYTAPDDAVGSHDDSPEAQRRRGADAPDFQDSALHLESKSQAEWKGFLGVLRKARPRAPINGALLAVDLGELCSSSDADLLAHAARLRARLSELREQLGIRFPVYVMLTKSDLLPGFNAYFDALSSEARAQVWGLTLPLQDSAAAPAPGSPEASGTGLQQRLTQELELLRERLAQGLSTRLQEEYDVDRRQALYLLPHELQALIPRLVRLLGHVFADSRFDTTQHQHMLRGVYFTSAAQPQVQDGPLADRQALIPRLMRALQARKGQAKGPAPQLSEGSHASFFITDVMREVVFSEAHLVRPNLRWEARFRLLRLLGHALVILLFVWLASAVWLSQKNNHDYLNDVAQRTEQLHKKVAAAQVAEHPERIAGLLTDARQLAQFTGLDLAQPDASYQYGLYSPPPVVQQASQLYAHLQDHMVLPVVIQRMEYRLQRAVLEGDEVDAYATLRAYLLLHDAQRFANDKSAAADLRAWVVDDWRGKDDAAEPAAANAATPSAAQSAKPAAPAASAAAPRLPKAVPSLAQSFGNSAVMVEHLRELFSGQRPVQSRQTSNEALVKRVRQFLETRSTSERLYERTKRAVASDTPRDFSLVRALGPQAGAVFRRDSSASLEQGVPGLFTYDGYHDVFAKRLSELVKTAIDDDAWAMGRSAAAPGQANAAARPASGEDLAALMEDVRRQYLQEYARHWSSFLSDLRLREPAAGDAMAFEVGLIRQLAAADSPLARLGRMAARETTLSRPLVGLEPREKSLIDRASDELAKNTAKLNDSLGLRPEQRLERQVVDDSFAALREVVVGQPDPAQGAVVPPRMELVAGVLNEYYTTLVVAQTAIEGQSLPPPAGDSANKLRIEAGKLPAPFRQVLLDVSSMGSDKVARGAAAILRTQARTQLDRLMGLMTVMVTEPCRRQIAGRYPFANSTQEVAADDFNAFFAAGGAADEYFTKYLLPLVDTSARPWRYKSPESAQLMVGPEGLAEGKPLAPVSNGPTLLGELLRLLQVSGPPLEPFLYVQAIRETYFREPGAKRMSWKQDIRVASLDPTVTELVIDVDGQVQRYAHGPVQAWVTSWPGPRGGLGLDLSVQPKLRPDTAVLQARGPWAPLRLLERGKVTPGASGGRLGLEVSFDGRKAVLEVQTQGLNPLGADLLRQFKCPAV